MAIGHEYEQRILINLKNIFLRMFSAGLSVLLSIIYQSVKARKAEIADPAG